MKTIGQSVVKANNDVYENGNKRKNEDALFISEQIIAISDGAGGVGILADEWSKTLVNNIPDKPFKSAKNIDEWVSLFWEEFYNEYLEELNGDSWKIRKFEEEGSLATLSALWEVGKSKFEYRSYGDSAMFVFNRNTGELKIQNNLKPVNSFTASPPLINWQTEQFSEEYYYSQSIEIDSDEEIILATDGIAMYIHAAWLVYKDAINEEILESKMQKIIDYFNANPITDFVEW
ncbi:MAG: hypothetical protein GXO89_17360, partial [Chlorobi bacterium]|nr:hypothetical protein [Chlorobiota bacterium]